MSKTPRTDAVWDNFSKGGHINHDAVFKHARELEEEIASLKDANAFLTDTYENRAIALESENERLRERIESGRSAHNEDRVRADTLARERDQLLATFRHTHVNNGVDDACKQCGLDLRNEIHKRLSESHGRKCSECGWSTWDKNVALCLRCGCSRLT